MIKNLRKGQLLYFFQPYEGRLWVLNFQCGHLGGLIFKSKIISPILAIGKRYLDRTGGKNDIDKVNIIVSYGTPYE
jgi:hypothetical protein